MTYLTETPWPPTIMLAIVAAFLAWNAMRSGSRKLRRVAGVVGVLAVAPLVIDRLVETDREKLTASLHDLADAVVASDLDRALSFVDGVSGIPDSARDVIESGLQRIEVHEGLRIKGIKIEVADSTATSDFRANGTVSVKGGPQDQHAATRWQLTWKKTATDWKITRVARLDPLSGEVKNTYYNGN